MDAFWAMDSKTLYYPPVPDWLLATGASQERPPLDINP